MAISDAEFLEEYGEEYCDYLLMPTNNEVRLKPMELFCTMFIAVAKRGNTTTEFINKIEKGLEDDLQYTAELRSEVINLVYKFYGGYIDETNAERLMNAWLSDIPEIALRVRLTLEQATNSGLTALTVIGRAMIKYPDFPWARLKILCPGELTNYMAAVEAVDGNAYYGFKKSLGVARSTLYSSLAYVAKELLVKLNGETSLKRYKGWIRAPKNAAVVAQLISSYEQTYTAAVAGDNAPAVDVALMTALSNKLNEPRIREMFA